MPYAFRTMNDARITLVEDDPEIAALLAEFLTREGFQVDTADCAAALDRRVRQPPVPDLVVLDWMLPGEDGLSICRRLHGAGGPPVIMLTARDEDIDRVLALEMGADDYVAKPFNPRVLLARIRAVLRRVGPKAASEPAPVRLRVAHLVVDLAGRRVLTGHDERELQLTGAEFDLLHCFVTHPQRVLSRDQLLDWTRGRVADMFDRTIDVQVSRLRRRLDDGGSGATDLVRTVRNAGYILAVPVRSA